MGPLFSSRILALLRRMGKPWRSDCGDLHREHGRGILDDIDRTWVPCELKESTLLGVENLCHGSMSIPLRVYRAGTRWFLSMS
jgi:hypothetical protein